MNLTFRRRLFILLALIVSVIPLLFCSCGQRVPTIASGIDKEKENPWRKAVQQFRTDTDIGGCQRIIGQLKNDLSATHDDKWNPPGLSTQEEKELRNLLRLHDDDLAEIRPAAFSNLDPHYLAECFYIRDTVRSLEIADLPASVQAAKAFDWTCRQVALNPWVAYQQVRNNRGQVFIQPIPLAPLPPARVLLRGFGSGLERAYVFLAALQQLKLDGCLVGRPDSETRGWEFPGSDGSPKGPFWSVGVRIGPDVFLFDPWKGLPLPAPDGKTATLAQVTANPEMLKNYYKGNPGEPTLDQIKESIPFLTVPLSSLAPRCTRLEKELSGDVDAFARLSTDPSALKLRFKNEAKVEVRFWAPVEDQSNRFPPCDYLRVLASFMPADQGGMGRAKNPTTGTLLYEGFTTSTMPPSVERMANGEFPADLAKILNIGNLPGNESIAQRMGLRAKKIFEENFLKSPLPREQIQRGQFADVTARLVEIHKEFAAGQERLRSDTNREQALRDWFASDQAFQKEIRSLDKNAPNFEQQLQEKAEEYAKKVGDSPRALIDVITSDYGVAESTYLIALSMHEQAERAQTRLERVASDPKQRASLAVHKERAARAWSEAKGWWAIYDGKSGESYLEMQHDMYPGRDLIAKRLAERAEKLFYQAESK